MPQPEGTALELLCGRGFVMASGLGLELGLGLGSELGSGLGLAVDATARRDGIGVVVVRIRFDTAPTLREKKLEQIVCAYNVCHSCAPSR